MSLLGFGESCEMISEKYHYTNAGEIGMGRRVGSKEMYLSLRPESF